MTPSSACVHHVIATHTTMYQRILDPTCRLTGESERLKCRPLRASLSSDLGKSAHVAWQHPLNAVFAVNGNGGHKISLRVGCKQQKLGLDEMPKIEQSMHAIPSGPQS